MILDRSESATPHHQPRARLEQLRCMGTVDVLSETEVRLTTRISKVTTTWNLWDAKAGVFQEQ